MKERREDFTIGVIQDVDKKTLKRLIGRLVSKAVRHTGEPDEGDYINYQYGSYKGSARTEIYRGSTGVVIRYRLEYYDSADQEKELDSKVGEIMKSLDLDGKSDYEKLAAIHEYICDNVEYDTDGGSDLKRTAYGALVNGRAVCQGYSNALYRLLLEAGVDNRIIFGKGIESSGITMSHTWNIVGLYGKYYYVDATWDDSTGSLDYFVRPKGEFDESHVPGEEHSSASFADEYPVADSEFTVDIGRASMEVISCAEEMAELLSRSGASQA